MHRAGAIAALLTGLLVLGLLEMNLIDMKLPLSFGPPVAALLAQCPVFLLGSRLYPPNKRTGPAPSG